MTLIAQITETGVVIPAYADVLDELQTSFKAIYGDDVNLDNDSADGQWVAVIASAINDANAAIAASYRSYSPATAIGEGLSSVVKTNGIRRASSGNSTADLLLIGQAWTTISNGSATDGNGYKWALPSSVVIPTDGEITITATCTTAGAVNAASGTITKIATPTLGWQSVTNPGAATAGSLVETDSTLRTRQTASVTAPSLSVWDGVRAAVSSLSGVTRIGGIENDTGTTDANGVPAHSIAMVVEGGDASEIASAILLKKGPGASTYGTTTTTANDAYGVPRPVNWSRRADVPIKTQVTIKALDGYETKVGTAIQSAISDFINALDIGEDVTLTDLYLPAKLNGDSQSAYYKLVGVQTAYGGGAFSTTDIVIAFNAAASSQTSDVTIVVTT